MFVEELTGIPVVVGAAPPYCGGGAENFSYPLGLREAIAIALYYRIQNFNECFFFFLGKKNGTSFG